MLEEMGREMFVTDALLASARVLGPTVVADRRTIHQHPELAFQEHQTAALVAVRLRNLGLDVREGVGGTGVIGLLRGAKPGRTVLLRADMDALPVQEETGHPYASRVPNVMHACGHDAHTAMLLGAARLLAEHREQIAGTVKFMFQPAEEIGGGALRMLDEGLLDDPQVDAAFALHTYPFPVGQIDVSPGVVTAATNGFSITVHGKGAGAGHPHNGVDPVLVSAHILTALQTLVSREVSPAESAVVHVGSLTAGTARNIMPETAIMLGTMRSQRPEIQEQLRARVSALAKGIATAMRASAEVEIRPGGECTINDPAMTSLVGSVVRDVLGPQAAVEVPPGTNGEDFANVLKRVPGAWIRVGIVNPGWDEPRPHHSPRFDLDEEMLPIGVAVLTGVAIRFLGEA